MSDARSTAVVVDLSEFRRQRGIVSARETTSTPQPYMFWLPVWVVMPQIQPLQQG